MNREDLFRAIGQVDEAVLARGEDGCSSPEAPVKKKSRSPWHMLAVAAMLAVVVMVLPVTFVLLSFGFGRGGMSAPAPRDMHYELMLDGDCLLFSARPEDPGDPDGGTSGTWRYDPERNETARLSDLPMTFRSAPDAIFGQAGPEIYRLDAEQAEHVATLPPDPEGNAPVLLGQTGEELCYYYTEPGLAGCTFCAFDLTDGSTRTIFDGASREEDGTGYLSPCYLRDGVLYFAPEYQSEEITVPTLDVLTGETGALHLACPEGLTYSDGTSAFYGDFALVYDRWEPPEGTAGSSLSRLSLLNYDTGELRTLAEDLPEVRAIRCQGSLVRLLLEVSGKAEGIPDTGAVLELDLEAGTRLLREEKLPAAVGEPCNAGFYYISEGRFTEKTLCFLDYATQSIETIPMPDGESS